MRFLAISRTLRTFSLTKFVINFHISWELMPPTASITVSKVICCCNTWSWDNNCRESLRLPKPDFEIAAIASGVISISSVAVIWLKYSTTAVWERDLKLNSWQREMIVGRTLCSSVVHRIKMVLAGGSSNSLSRAFWAAVVNPCASSIRNIL